MENQTMGRRIASLRKACGLTQEQLAERLGISAQAVSKWENDVSCPDISMLPQLAEIFGVSTDVILGIKAQTEPASGGADADKPRPKRAKRDTLAMGLLAIVIGAAYLFSTLTEMPLNIWSIVWPAVLLGLGISKTIERCTPVTLGLAFLGFYYLLYNLGVPMPFTLSWNLIWPAALILIGLSLLFFNEESGIPHSVRKHAESSYTEDDGVLRLRVKFSEEYKKVNASHVKGIEVNAAFCNGTLNLAEVASLEGGAAANVQVSFGDCRIILPRTVRLDLKTSTMLGNIDVHGAPLDNAPYTLTVNGNVSFGQLMFEYV